MKTGKRHRTRRSPAGSQIAEFGAALVMVATVIIVPLVDLLIVPVRWMMAQELANQYARKLAFCESFSQAHQLFDVEPTIVDRLNALSGVDVQHVDLQLRISRTSPYSDETIVVGSPGQIPDDWLPEGSSGPCLYALELKIELSIAPAILVPGGHHLPGLTAPIPTVITASHEWENLGRDPATGEFYVNE